MAVDSKIGPGDVVYFSGTISDRVILRKGGSLSGSITLDGYKTGETNPIQYINTNTALLKKGLVIENKSNNIEYLTIQDFRITDPNGWRPALQIKGNAPHYNVSNNYIIIRRNYVYEAGDALLTFFHGKNNIIVDNKFYVFGKLNNPPEKITQGAVFLLEFSNSLFARNEVGHDNSPITSGTGGSPELVSLFGSQNTLIELNNLYGTPGQTGLRPKEHPAKRPANYNIVIRHNKIHNNHNTKMGGGIHIHTRDNEPISDFYVYGNNIFGNGVDNLRIGTGVSNVYVWSNILSSAGKLGINVTGSSITENLHFYNNTIAHNNTSGDTDANRGGIGVANGSNVYIKNNIIWNNRPNGEKNKNQVNSWIVLNALEHNIYFHSLGTPTIYYSGWYQTLDNIKSKYGFENTVPEGSIQDPLFINPNGIDNIYGTIDDDYRLSANSPAIGKGNILSDSFNINLSNGNSWFQTQTGYDTLNFGFDDALCPIGTDWTTNPPTVISAKQGKNGRAWGVGAYVYGETSLQENPLAPPLIVDIQPN